MNNEMKRYIESRGRNAFSAIAKLKQSKEQDIIDNYIEQRQREEYLNEQAEKAQIDRIAREIAKAIDEVVKEET